MTTFNFLLYILIFTMIILFIFIVIFMVLQMKIEKRIFEKISKECNQDFVVLLDYRDPKYKEVDKYLTEIHHQTNVIIFISSSWLFKLKRKTWLSKNVVFIDSGLLKKRANFKILSRTEQGDIRSIKWYR